MTFTQFVYQLALLVRLPNSFTVISNIVAAYVLGSGGNIHGVSLITLVCASLCFYHGGMVLNDCVDVKEDRVHKAHRPLASGKIVLPIAWALACYLFLFGLLLVYQFGRHPMIIGVLLTMCIFAYNFSNRRGIVGCVLMGLCRGLNWLLPLAALGAVADFAHFAVLVGGYVVALTLLSRDEDDASHKWLLALSTVVLLLVFGFFITMLKTEQMNFILTLSVLICAGCVIAYQLWHLYKNYTPANLHRVVMFFILGLIPLDASLLLMSGHAVAAVLVLLLLVPSSLLARRMYVT